MARDRRWRRTFSAVLLLAVLAVALAWHWRPVTARPALWRISQGDRHGWLFGTIHAVPSGARWLSPEIEKAAGESDLLVLEAAGLEAERSDRRVFEALGRSPGLLPLAERVSAADRPGLEALRRASPQALKDLDGYQDWAAALLIGAAADTGASSVDAPEARLEKLFRGRGKPVRGLETIEAQLGRFDALPPADQSALLHQSIAEAGEAVRRYRLLYESWAAGDMAALDAQFLQPLARSPHLRDVLIDQRNELWAQAVDKLLRENGRVVFVAVGAGHLLGPESVQARLARRGWTVVRVQ
ncbi:MAG: TraB/GumN family protein [Sphingobium sp.]|nr:TraB/GumN family protein [Sphingobium sp.]